MPTGLSGAQSVNDSDWVLEFCNFKDAWAMMPPAGGKARAEGLIIAHPDTGYTLHPELTQGDRYRTERQIACNFIREWPLPTELLSAEDDLSGSSKSHGTSTASVMMSAEALPVAPGYTEARSVMGVAPLVNVIPLRVTKWVSLNDTSSAALARSIEYVVGRLNLDLVGVISISLGRSSIGGIEDSIGEALAAAKERGVIVCAAAGQLQQESWDPIEWHPPTFPGSDPNTICVAGCKADFSPLPSGFLGPQVDITAPGFNIWKADSHRELPRYRVSANWGTSYSTAIVAGACALWQAYHGRVSLLARYGAPGLFDAFKHCLQHSADDRGGTWDTALRGAGVLDAHKLLLEPLP